MVAGLGCLLLIPILGILMVFDDTQILGINRWIKPIKFLASITVFVWTVAVLLQQLPTVPRSTQWISWSIIWILFFEILIILLQAARGTKSHFNLRSILDLSLYGVMGVFIVSNTVIVAYLLVLFLRTKVCLPSSVLWGIRLGIFVFLVGSLEGGYMSAHMSHSVGARDGGKGLPFVNWSTVAGDLRVAHFFGLHAIQAIPLFALAMNRLRLKTATFLTFAFAASYLAMFSYLFLQALKGQPFLTP